MPRDVPERQKYFCRWGGPPLWQVALLIGSHQCPWGSISGIYNLQLLHSPFFQLSFSQSLLILEVVTILSMVWASLTPHDYFSKQTLHHILLWIAGGLTMLGLTNILVHWDFLSLLLITFLGYLVAKINPKVSSLLMSKLPAEKLASTSSFFGTDGQLCHATWDSSLF